MSWNFLPMGDEVGDKSPISVGLQTARRYNIQIRIEGRRE
jgi:hypothetical protein